MSIDWKDINKELPDKPCNVLMYDYLNGLNGLVVSGSYVSEGRFYESACVLCGNSNSIHYEKENQYNADVGVSQISHWAYINQPKEKDDN